MQETLATVLDEVRALRSDTEQLQNEIALMRQRDRPVPDERKYSKKEAGFRIAYGQDPTRVPAEKREAMQEGAYSESWVYRRLADDDSGLEKTMVEGKCRVTEKAIRNYERRVNRRKT